MKISILIPCHNEEQSIKACITSCLLQTRKPDEIVVVDDGSTDKSAEIIAGFGEFVKVLTIPVATGNKSYAQERGLQMVTGDVFIATDGDTVLHRDFVRFVEEDFKKSRDVIAVAGFVRSLSYNWLTACRAVEYTIGQHLHKLAQHYIGFLFVIPGAAGAFRTQEFLKHIPFEHDTLTEDLDFTYRLHKLGFPIFFDMRAIVYTQDPATLHSYINQVRRWFGGGWQCLLKHHSLAFVEPKVAFEISLLYMENVVFAVLLFLLPFLSIRYFAMFVAFYLIIIHICSAFAAWKEKRPTLLLVPFPYLLLIVINCYIFLEQCIEVVFLRRKNLFWFKPKRFAVNHNTVQLS
jgi:cellulose synthase/poly-beta-1,6-N-acetylglucosamine synthase-like glycosyltransferase